MDWGQGMKLNEMLQEIEQEEFEEEEARTHRSIGFHPLADEPPAKIVHISECRDRSNWSRTSTPPIMGAEVVGSEVIGFHNGKHIMLVEDEDTGLVRYMSMSPDGHLGGVED